MERQRTTIRERVKTAVRKSAFALMVPITAGVIAISGCGKTETTDWASGEVTIYTCKNEMVKCLRNGRSFTYETSICKSDRSSCRVVGKGGISDNTLHESGINEKLHQLALSYLEKACSQRDSEQVIIEEREIEVGKSGTNMVESTTRVFFHDAGVLCAHKR